MKSATTDFEKVTGNTASFTQKTGSTSNSGCIALRNFAIAIETTIYTTTGQILRAKIEEEYQVPVKYVIYTHYHGDHIFGSQAFKDLTIIGSIETANNIREDYFGNASWKQILEKEDPMAKGGLDMIPPTICFNDKLVIKDEELSVEIYHAGGHTSGSSFVYFPYERIIFTGDLIFNSMFPYLADPTCNPDLWIQQLERIKNIDPEI
ncbi:MAG: MBL fold metallo-hydrolase, partial [Candidatus Hodarchaeales archaeon]